MTYIDISDDLRITMDKYQWIINTKEKGGRDEETGEQLYKWQARQYWPSLTLCVEACMQLELTKREAVTVQNIADVWAGMLDVLGKAIAESPIEDSASKEFERIHG
jgi:hypothetical protein